MEYLTVSNIVTALVVLLMIGCVVKLFASDIGSNKTFYIIAFIGLGVGLYVWRSENRQYWKRRYRCNAIMDVGFS